MRLFIGFLITCILYLVYNTGVELLVDKDFTSNKNFAETDNFVARNKFLGGNEHKIFFLSSPIISISLIIYQQTIDESFIDQRLISGPKDSQGYISQVVPPPHRKIHFLTL